MSNLFDKTDRKLLGVFLRAFGLVTLGLSSKKISLGSAAWSNMRVGEGVAKHVVVGLFDAAKTSVKGVTKLGEMSMLIDVDVWERLMGPIEADDKELSKPNPIWGTEARAKLGRLRGDIYTAIDALKEDAPTSEVIENLELAIQTSGAPTEDWDRLEFCIEAFKALSEEERAKVVSSVYGVPPNDKEA